MTSKNKTTCFNPALETRREFNARTDVALASRIAKVAAGITDSVSADEAIRLIALMDAN